jgi:hypothetical protein
MNDDKFAAAAKTKNIHCNVVSLMTPPLNAKKPLLGQGLIIKNILTPEYCNNLILNAENCARFRGGWRTKRHDNFPTTDLDVFIDFPAYLGIDLLYDLAPLTDVIKDFYKLPSASQLNSRDIFLARFISGGQQGLNIHCDGSQFSFVIALNDKAEYEGGGTMFPNLSPDIMKKMDSNGNVFKLDIGDIIIFPGGVVPHASEPILSGKRYILAGFIYFSSVQKGLDVHISHRAQMLTDAASSLGMEAADLAKSFTASHRSGTQQTYEPIVKHRQVYEGYLNQLNILSSRWHELTGKRLS